PITGTFNFIGGTTVFTLSGRVIDGTGAGLSSILVTLTGSQQRMVVTDSNGNYSLPGLFAGGNFTVKPSQVGFVFSPTQAVFNNLSADRTVPTFVGTMHPYSITGQVLDNLGNPLNGVLMMLLRAGGNEGVATSTNASGNYTFTNIASEATYTLTPFKAGYTFSPASVTFTTPSGNQVANFVGTPFPTVQFSVGNYDVSEGGISALVTVTRTGDTTISSTVDFASTNGTASQLRDYEVANGTVSFSPGETSRNFRVLIVDDVYSESSETINLTLSNPTNATLGTQITATVTIQDNDSSGSISPVARQFVSNLVGAEEVPPTGNTVKGNGGIFQLSNDELTAKVSLIFSGLTGNETGAHVHNAAPGVNGPIIFPLPLGNPLNDFVVNPTSQQVTDLRTGQLYMNVHSDGFQNGEIRGQLRWNPAEEADFFVRQAYFDFLSRVPDQGGFDFWVGQITQCQSNVQCLRNARINVSNAFFYELEFQQTAAYVLRLYRGAYGNNQPFPNTNPDPNFPNEEKKLPNYSVFVTDRARVIGGANLAQKQLDLANLFVARPEFVAKYPVSLATAEQFVDAVLAVLLNDLGVNLSSQRPNLINLYNSGGSSRSLAGNRAAVMYRLADDNTATNPIANQPLIDAEYNRTFVLGQYFGYLRRNPDIAGFIFWLGQVNGAPLRDVPRQHAMVCSFITSGEYQLRFGPVASRNNNECPQ
ncbi:MAG TPA: CHRD domain-containing protein, partial [Pyrinomonadaceae bacterium]|nr:CHRD domain-containing protein [Pyrinomonadaceae bacterium]